MRRWKIVAALVLVGLNAQGTPTRTVVEPLATHAFLRATPGEIVAWFRAHDPGA